MLLTNLQLLEFFYDTQKCKSIVVAVKTPIEMFIALPIFKRSLVKRMTPFGAFGNSHCL